MLKNLRGQPSNVDISSIKTTVEAILVDTGATLDDKIDAIDALIDTIETRTDFLCKTTFKQETVIATAVDGETWKDLLDKSDITKPTKICGFKLTVAGSWSGVAKMRITNGAGDAKLWPFDAESVQDTDWTTAVQEILNFPVLVPVATGYKVQFRSSDGGDGAGDTLQLNNLDVIEAG